MQFTRVRCYLTSLGLCRVYVRRASVRFWVGKVVLSEASEDVLRRYGLYVPPKPPSGT